MLTLILLGCTDGSGKIENSCADACRAIYTTCADTLWGAETADTEYAVREDACIDDCSAAVDEGRYTESETWTDCVLQHEDDISRDPPDVTACQEVLDCGVSPCATPSFGQGEGWMCYP